MSHPLTDFERGILANIDPANVVTDLVKTGSGRNPPLANDRYALSFKLLASAAVIGLTVKDYKYALRFRDTPGENLAVGVNVTGKADYPKSGGGYDPTGAAILYDQNPGIMWVRDLVADGETLNQPSSYRARGGNKDGIGGGSITNKFGAFLNGYNWDIRNYKDGLDGKIGGSVERMVMENCRLMERVWSSLTMRRASCKYYLGNGRGFVWLFNDTSSMEFYQCEWYLGTEANPGQKWSRPQDIPGQHLQLDGGSVQSQLIDVTTRPAWLDEPFWAQARVLAGAPADPPTADPTQPADPTPPGTTPDPTHPGQMAQIAADIAALKSRVTDTEASIASLKKYAGRNNYQPE